MEPSSPARVHVVAGIAGSLRRGSFNRALLRAAVELAPQSLRIEVHDLSALPFYNGDVEAAGDPEAVLELREKVGRADALLVATPEYNHGVPGVLKNAIDWLSRPPGKSVLKGKTAAILGASPGMTGTARAQAQLRQSFVFTDTCAMMQPEMLVARAAEKFDAEGRLTDESTRRHLAAFLERFSLWIGGFEGS